MYFNSFLSGGQDREIYLMSLLTRKKKNAPPVYTSRPRGVIEILDDNGRIYTLSHKQRDMTDLYIGDLKEFLKGPDKANLKPQDMTLMFNELELNDKQTLKQVNFIPSFHKLKLVRNRELHPSLSKQAEPQLDTPAAETDAKQQKLQSLSDNGTTGNAQSQDPSTMNQIVVIHPGDENREYTITTNMTDTAAFSTIKKKLFELTNIPLSEIVLAYEGREIMSLSDIDGGIPKLPLYLFKRGEDTTGAHLGIRIAYTHNGTSKVVVLNSKWDLMRVPIFQLKKRLSGQVSASPEEMTIYYGNYAVDDNKTCQDIEFDKRDTLTLTIGQNEQPYYDSPNQHNVESRLLTSGPRNVRVLDHMKQREYLVNGSGCDISQAKVSTIKQALHTTCGIPPSDQQLSIEGRMLLDTDTCRGLFPEFPEYRLSLSRKEAATITLLFDDFTESVQVSVPPSSTVNNLRDIIKADSRVQSLPEGQDFILKFNGVRLPPHELLEDRRVFTYSVVKLAKVTRGRRFSAPDLRTIRQYEKLAVHQPRERWLALGFRIGAWEGLDKSSAMRPARFGRVLRNYQKNRRRSATAVAMPTDMPPSSWFRYLGYRMPVVLALTRTVCDKINNKLSSPVRIRAGDAVPPSPLADTFLMGVNRPISKRPPPTFQDPNLPQSPRERTRSTSSAPAHSIAKKQREYSVDSPYGRETSVNEKQTVVKISEEDGFAAGQEKGYNWGQLAHTMGKTTEVSRGLRGLPTGAPPLQTANETSVRTQPDRGQILPTPQANRAAQLHHCLAPPTSVSGSRILHSQSLPRPPIHQSMSPAMSAAPGLIERLTAIEVCILEHYTTMFALIGKDIFSCNRLHSSIM